MLICLTQNPKPQSPKHKILQLPEENEQLVKSGARQQSSSKGFRFCGPGFSGFRVSGFGGFQGVGVVGVGNWGLGFQVLGVRVVGYREMGFGVSGFGGVGFWCLEC